MKIGPRGTTTNFKSKILAIITPYWSSFSKITPSNEHSCYLDEWETHIKLLHQSQTTCFDGRNICSLKRSLRKSIKLNTLKSICHSFRNFLTSNFITLVIDVNNLLTNYLVQIGHMVICGGAFLQCGSITSNCWTTHLY